jgi:hypothetical protein
MTVNLSPSLPAHTARPLLRPAEIALAALWLITLAGTAALALARGIAVDWAAFAPLLAPGTAMMALAVFARWRGLYLALAPSLFGLGFYAVFGTTAAILIYLRFPLDPEPADSLLATWDFALGYVWADWVRALADWPLTLGLLGHVYDTVLIQLLAVLFLLGLLRQTGTLTDLLLAGCLTLLCTIAVWFAFPAIGPAAHFGLPPGAEGLGLSVGADYIAALHRLADLGPGLIEPDDLIGTVAFPSYHIQMSLLVTWALWRTALRWPAAAVTLLMVPATLIHGGHHLVDVLAGCALFALVAALTPRLTRALGD